MRGERESNASVMEDMRWNEERGEERGETGGREDWEGGRDN